MTSEFNPESPSLGGHGQQQPDPFDVRLGRDNKRTHAEAFLSHGDDAVVKRALLQLREVGSSQSVKPVVRLLETAHPDLQAEAIYTLAAIRHRSAVTPLLKTLSSPHAIVREAGAVALGYLGDKRALFPLVKSMEDVDERVVQAAVIGAARLKDKRVFRPLTVLLQRRHDSEKIQAAIATAYGYLGDPRAVNTLAHLLDDVSHPIHSAALKSLEQIGTERALQAVEAWRYQHGRDR